MNRRCQVGVEADGECRCGFQEAAAGWQEDGMGLRRGGQKIDEFKKVDAGKRMSEQGRNARGLHWRQADAFAFGLT